MAALTTVTIPTPEPYDASNPDKQRENLCYVVLQILLAAKTNNESVSLDTDALTFNGQVLDLGFLRVTMDGKVTSLGV
jgi:hypothetical protein